MHTGLIVSPSQLVVFICRWLSHLPLSLFLRPASYSLFFHIRPSRNILREQNMTMSDPSLRRSAISGLSIFLYQVQSSCVILTSEFVQCLGSSITAQHIAQNAVHPGPLCTLQGILVECGDVASSVWSFVIAVHTFILLAGGPRIKAWIAEKGTSGKVRWILCVGIWLSVVFLAVIGPILIRGLNPENGPFCISIFLFD